MPCDLANDRAEYTSDVEESQVAAVELVDRSQPHRCRRVDTNDPGKVQKVEHSRQEDGDLGDGDERPRCGLCERHSVCSHALPLLQPEQASPFRSFTLLLRGILSSRIPGFLGEDDDEDPADKIQDRVDEEAPAPVGAPGDEGFHHRREVGSDDYAAGPEVDHAAGYFDDQRHDLRKCSLWIPRLTDVDGRRTYL